MKVIFTFRFGGRTCEILAFANEAAKKPLWSTEEYERFGSDVKASMMETHSKFVEAHWREIPLARRQNMTLLFPQFNVGGGDRRYIRFEQDGVPRLLRAHHKSNWSARDCFLIRLSV